MCYEKLLLIINGTTIANCPGISRKAFFSFYEPYTMHNKDHFTQMLAFLWACQYGNFSAAAREKNMSPSAISKLIPDWSNVSRSGFF